MKDHGDQLREVFETKERLAPDAAAVYARVQELSTTYKRRRRGGQVAGGAVLGAGLIAGVINLPAVLPAEPASESPAVVVAAAPSSAAPSVSAPPAASPAVAAPPADKQRYWDAYFRAGYDHDDAKRLAKLWNSKAQIADVKAEAGRRLLAGETLPFAATPNPPQAEEPVDREAVREWQAFSYAGYDYDDAVQLARLWRMADPGDAKVEAGKRLLAGQELPIRPDAANVAAALEAKRVNAFFDAGYDVDDAVQLAKIWKSKNAYGAKVEGGKRLLAGQTLPIRP